MANIVGLIALANGMRNYLATVGASGTQVTTVGWRQREQILNQGTGGANRISLYPGLEPGGKYGAGGELTRNNRPSTTNPRALLTWRKPVTMSVWAVDTSGAEYSEENQITAVENLLELAVQAVHASVDPDTNTNAGLAAIEWGDVRYTKPPVNMAFGLEIMVEFTMKCPLFEQTVDICYPQFKLGAKTNSSFRP